MIKHRNKELRNDLKEFRENVSDYMKYQQRFYLDFIKEAPEEMLVNEIPRLKKRYNDEMLYHISKHPLYVGKRWKECNISSYYYRISNIEWDIPEITDERLYPIIKKIVVDDCHLNGKICSSSITEYPESNEDFLCFVERFQGHEIEDN
jgi:hypothetical protein